jgi:hypothetical protein
MDKLQLTGPNLCQDFNFRSGCVSALHLLCYGAKLPNLKLKTRSKQLLSSLPFDIALLISCLWLIDILMMLQRASGRSLKCKHQRYFPLSVSVKSENKAMVGLSAYLCLPVWLRACLSVSVSVCLYFSLSHCVCVCVSLEQDMILFPLASREREREREMILITQ